MAGTAPGEVAEAGFVRLGMIIDPATSKRKVVWALIIVLSYSGHYFVWPTHSQKLEDVIAGLEAAWAFFGGVPRYLVIENFPAAVAGPDAPNRAPAQWPGFEETCRLEDIDWSASITLLL